MVQFLNTMVCNIDDSKYRFMYFFGQIFIIFIAYKNLYLLLLQLQIIICSVLNISILIWFPCKFSSQTCPKKTYLSVRTQKSKRLSIKFMFLGLLSSTHNNNKYCNYFSNPYLKVFPLAIQTNEDFITATYCYK